MEGEGDGVGVEGFGRHGQDELELQYFLWNGVDEVPRRVTVAPYVTEIREGAFEGRSELREVDLPDGLRRIGPVAFSDCRSLLVLRVPSTVEKIGDGAFFLCKSLREVELPEGLRQIEAELFFGCVSLLTINVPSTVEEIGNAAFIGCGKLSEATLPDGLRRLGKRAFYKCRSLQRIKIPVGVQRIEPGAFYDCDSLVEVAFSEGLVEIGSNSFDGCKSLPAMVLPSSLTMIRERAFASQPNLRNVAFPPGCVAHDIFDLCDALMAAFPGCNDDEMANALKQRFDRLPIHKVCYYQSYHEKETAMMNLRREINPWSSKFPGQLNPTGKQQDCLGMTPLHILACSTAHCVEMFQLLVEKYPEALVTNDEWGDTPLLYAVWCSAQDETVHFLMESYKTHHPDYEHDWAGMVKTLCKAHAPLSSVQALVSIQRFGFPSQQCDLQLISLELARADANKFLHQRECATIDVFRYLISTSVSDRLDSLNVERWGREIGDDINRFPERPQHRAENATKLYVKVALFKLIKEASTILELALWKMKIDESSPVHRCKRARVDGADDRRAECRISCGADVVIRNVLPYLLPVPLFVLPPRASTL